MIILHTHRSESVSPFLVWIKIWKFPINFFIATGLKTTNGKFNKFFFETFPQSYFLCFSFHCSVDMKCMVSYIQWYHEPFNGEQSLRILQWENVKFAGSMKLLRTGANRGNPYSYEIKVWTSLFSSVIKLRKLPHQHEHCICLNSKTLEATEAD